MALRKFIIERDIPKVGTFEREPGHLVYITRHNGQLLLSMDGVRFDLFAESPTRFFAKTTDVQCDFKPDDQGKVDQVIISVGEGSMTSRRIAPTRSL